jgi:hypothetical protein
MDKVLQVKNQIMPEGRFDGDTTYGKNYIPV